MHRISRTQTALSLAGVAHTPNKATLIDPSQTARAARALRPLPRSSTLHATSYETKRKTKQS